MLKIEIEQVNIGQEIYYRYHYDSPPYKYDVPKQKVKLLDKTNFRKKIELNNGKIIDCLTSELYFSSEENDWELHQNILIQQNPGITFDTINLYYGTHLITEIREITTIADARNYIDRALSAPEDTTMQAATKKACEWWVEEIKKFSPTAEPKDGFKRGEVESLLMKAALHLSPPATDGSLLNFSEKLEASIQIISRFPPVKSNHYLLLSTENIGDLCPLLADAAEGLIDDYAFPVKTVMHIHPENLSVKCGYAAPFVEVPV